MNPGSSLLDGSLARDARQPTMPAPATDDPRTPLLLPVFNALLSRHLLPTLSHPTEATPSLLIALCESLIESRLASITRRRDKSPTSQIRNIKLMLGEMVMRGWDVGGIDPQGLVEREETCLMDVIEVFLQIGKDKYGLRGMSPQEEENVEEHELGTISERESDDDSVSTITGIHSRAADILTRIHTLNQHRQRPASPTERTISRGTQTSPPPLLTLPPTTTRLRRKIHTPRKRAPPRRREKGVQTDDDTESGIPSSIPLSYCSSASSSLDSPTFPKLPFRRLYPQTHPSRRPLNSFRIGSPLHSFSPRVRYSSSSSEGFRVDSPYTAALRRRRQAAIDSLRKLNPPKPRRIRVFSQEKDVGDSTFAEDSDASPLPPPRVESNAITGKTRKGSGRTFLPRSTTARRTELMGDEGTDGLTDLETKVRALKIRGGVEQERKEWLLNELQRKKESNTASQGIRIRGRSGSMTSGSGSSGSLFSFVR